MHKILIADDNHTYRDSLVQEFNRSNEQVIIATDGDEAFSQAEKEQPDIIIMDIMLPKKLGLNVIEELKLNDRTKFIPVIAISNFGGEQNKNRALEIGANDFITKSSLTTAEIADQARKYLP